MEMLSLFDYLALGTIVIFTLLSMWRGVVAEVMGLLSWLVAFVVAQFFAQSVAKSVLAMIEPASLALLVAFVAVFLVVKLVWQLLQTLLTDSAKAVGLGGINRILGGVVGAMKGVLLVVMVVLLSGLTRLPESPEWRQAQTAFVFEGLAEACLPYLPEAMAAKIHYR